jgi:D-alanyl-D-alanine carboxypeptidase
LSNHNRLLYTIDGCTGLKTGYTRAAGRTLVSCVERDGRRLVAVTLQDGNDWEDHATLFEYGFSAFSRETLLRRGETAECVPVIDGEAESVDIVAADTLSWTVGEGEKLSVRCELPRVLAAPVKAGTVVGQAILLLDGAEVARTKLLCAESVSAAVPVIPERRSLFQRLRTGERIH